MVSCANIFGGFMNEFEWLDIFADNLKERMKECKITQQQLAEETDISQATISKYLNKRQMPGIKAIINISEILEWDLEDMLYFGSMID